MSHHTLAEVAIPGTRLTSQRQLIWNLLHHDGEHLTAESIRQRLVEQLPSVNLPTVYRNLVVLRRLGLVQELSMVDGAARFEAIMPGEEHSHLVCRGCRRIEHPTSPALSTAVAAAVLEQGFTPPSREVLIYATCADCQAS